MPSIFIASLLTRDLIMRINAMQNTLETKEIHENFFCFFLIATSLKTKIRYSEQYFVF